MGTQPATTEPGSEPMSILLTLPSVLAFLSQASRKQDSNTNNVSPRQPLVQPPVQAGLLLPAVSGLHINSAPWLSSCLSLTRPPSAFWPTKGKARKVRRKEPKDLSAFV